MHGSIAPSVARRGHVFWIRKSIPAEFAASLGTTDIRRSLFTSDTRMSKRSARTLVSVVEEAFETLRSMGLPPQARSALDAVIDHVMDDFDSNGRRKEPIATITNGTIDDRYLSPIRTLFT